MVDFVHTMGSTTVFDTRLNWTRVWDTEFRLSNGFDFSQLGFPKSLVANPQSLVMPLISFSDAFTGLGTNEGSRTPTTGTSGSQRSTR
jgi:hypothetical protein